MRRSPPYEQATLEVWVLQVSAVEHLVGGWVVATTAVATVEEVEEVGGVE
jgi:hypothetical protein